MVKICPPFLEYMSIPFRHASQLCDHLKEMDSFKKGGQRHGHDRIHHGC